MKKISIKALAATLIAAVTAFSSLAFEACGKNNADNKWRSNSSKHWRVTEDGENLESTHDFNEGTCKVCGYHKHIWSEEFTYDGVGHWRAPLCTDTQEKLEYSEHVFEDGKCTVCNAVKIDHTRQPAVAQPFKYSYVVGKVRVQTLSDTVVRIEEIGTKGFEDRASFTVVNRNDWHGAEGEVEQKEGYTQISTKGYNVIIPDRCGADGVYVTDKSGKTLYTYAGRTDTNVYIPSPSDELKSWYFTDTLRVIPSYYGYSATATEDLLQGWDFNSVATDVFVFLPGGSYKQFCSDYVSLTGRSEMVNLSTLGFWDSRWYAYNSETAIQQIEDYRSRGYAIDVLVIDTDWRDSSGSGIGYDINERLFPDMAEFLKQCEELGVDICFNDHPEPVKGTGSLLDKEEVEYRGEKLTLLLSLGLDYWWYDRNWSVSLNPINNGYSVYALGMYAYQWITQDYYESIADINEYARRGLIMGNVDGCLHGEWKYASDISAHRNSIQWTGDISSTDLDLAQELYATVMGGAEIGLPYMSSDIGGHTRSVSDEMYMRWIQYGALSTICRVHCTNASIIGQEGRMPWLFGEEAEKVAHTYLDMRYRLMPVFYNLVRENYDTGLPVMRRLDIEYSQYVEAARNDEYLLGENILVAPVTEAKGNDKRTVFIPDGVWIDVWTGDRFNGPQTINVAHPLQTSPIFVREGALIPLADNGENTDAADWSNLTLDVYPSVNLNTQTRLYEDDTNTVAYKDGHYRTTDIKMNYDATVQNVKISIDTAKGEFTGERACAERKWKIRVHTGEDWGKITGVKINGEAFDIDKIVRRSKNTTANPFATEGGARDGVIYEFNVNTEVNKEYELECTFDRVPEAVASENAYRSSVPFELTAEATETRINLTDAGTLGWASFGESGTKNMVVSEGAADMFTMPTTNRVTGSPQSEAISSGSGLITKTYSNGQANRSYNGSGALVTNKDFVFEINTDGTQANYTVLVGGSKSTLKVTVRDESGNVQTVYSGNIDGEYADKIIIKCPKSSGGKLYVTVSAVASEPNGTDTFSKIKLFGCYAAEYN